MNTKIEYLYRDASNYKKIKCVNSWMTSKTKMEGTRKRRFHIVEHITRGNGGEPGFRYKNCLIGAWVKR